MFNAATVARTGRYWTPKSPVNRPEADWTLTVEGQYVSVPVNAYRMMFQGPVGILHSGLLLATLLMDKFRKQCQEEIETVHFVLGNDVHPVSDTELRCYVGFSIQTK